MFAREIEYLLYLIFAQSLTAFFILSSPPSLAVFFDIKRSSISYEGNILIQVPAVVTKHKKGKRASRSNLRLQTLGPLTGQRRGRHYTFLSELSLGRHGVEGRGRRSAGTMNLSR
jgi:hypothetical protein